MNLFSQRKGLTPIRNQFQIDSMDDDLRNGLWNVLSIYYWERFSGRYLSSNPFAKHFIENLWVYYFKLPLDTIDENWPMIYIRIRDIFFKSEWYEVYDFIEFIANQYNDSSFIESCNQTLKREMSAYRFVGGILTQITVEEEILEIEDALLAPKPISNHLNRALQLLSDRKTPDYRNSIKESISAVEAVCQLVSNNNKATLGQALKTIENKVVIHPALKSAFNSMYGYTSDADGIRHALLDEATLDFEDAKFMMVSCSGFINYLLVKASKVGIAF